MVFRAEALRLAAQSHSTQAAARALNIAWRGSRAQIKPSRKAQGRALATRVHHRPARFVVWPSYG